MVQQIQIDKLRAPFLRVSVLRDFNRMSNGFTVSTVDKTCVTNGITRRNASFIPHAAETQHWETK